MKLKDVPDECRRCCNLKTAHAHMDGNHDMTCRMSVVGMRHMQYERGTLCKYFVPTENYVVENKK